MPNPESGLDLEEYQEESEEAENKFGKAREAEIFLKDLESMRQYLDIAEDREKAKNNKTLLVARRGRLVSDIHHDLEDKDEELRIAVMISLPKEVRNSYERFYPQELKPEKKGLFSKMKEKLGGWFKKRSSSQGEEKVVDERLLNPDLFI